MVGTQQNSIYSKIKEYLVIIGIFIGIPIFWVLSAGLIYSSLTYFIAFDADKDIWAVRGTFGDSFGAVNGLFTGLAFAGTLYAIWLQRKDLAAQQVANEKQASEITEQTKAIAEQTKSIANELEESKKQTQELTRQIQLSITPAFVIEIKPTTYGIDKEVVVSCEFEITNIGNGTGTNISIEDVPVPIKDFSNGSIKFEALAFSKPQETKRIRTMATCFSQTKEITLKKFNEEEHSTYKTNTFMYETYNKEKLYTLRITFQDIEATKYKQEIYIGKNACIPGKVEIIK